MVEQTSLVSKRGGAVVWFEQLLICPSVYLDRDCWRCVKAIAKPLYLFFLQCDKVFKAIGKAFTTKVSLCVPMTGHSKVHCRPAFPNQY